MPKFSMSVPHTLGREQATERLKGFLAKIKERHKDQVSNLQEEWAGNLLKFSFTTFGFKIGGATTVEENEVKLDGDIPFAAMMFKGKIEQEIRESLNKVLA
ncbi:MAG: polyhydroxyalkanoic acid system family protein [Pirellulales bacterium]